MRLRGFRRRKRRASNVYTMIPCRMILTQMRNAPASPSLLAATINNRDKGFIVARETVAHKSLGLFPICQLSVPPSRSETEGPRAALDALSPSARAAVLAPSQISTAMECVSGYTYVTFTSTVR